MKTILTLAVLSTVFAAQAMARQPIPEKTLIVCQNIQISRISTSVRIFEVPGGASASGKLFAAFSERPEGRVGVMKTYPVKRIANPRQVGSGTSYVGPGFSLGVNFTTAPLPDGSRHGSVVAEVMGRRISTELTCRRQ